MARTCITLTCITLTTLLSSLRVASAACPAPDANRYVAPAGHADVSLGCSIEIWSLTEEPLDLDGITIAWEGGDLSYQAESAAETQGWGYDHYDCRLDTCETELFGSYSWTYDGVILRPDQPLPAHADITVLDAEGNLLSSFRTSDNDVLPCPRVLVQAPPGDCVDMACEDVLQCRGEQSDSDDTAGGCSLASNRSSSLSLFVILLALLGFYRRRRI